MASRLEPLPKEPLPQFTSRLEQLGRYRESVSATLPFQRKENAQRFWPLALVHP